MAKTGNPPPAVNLAWLHAIDQDPRAVHGAGQPVQATPPMSGSDCAGLVRQDPLMGPPPIPASVETGPAEHPAAEVQPLSADPSANRPQPPADTALQPSAPSGTDAGDGHCAEISARLGVPTRPEGATCREAAPAVAPDRNPQPQPSSSANPEGDQRDPGAPGAGTERFQLLCPPDTADASTASANTLMSLRNWWLRLFKARARSTEKPQDPHRRARPPRVIYVIALVMAGGAILGLALNGSGLIELSDLFKPAADTTLQQPLHHVAPTSAP